MLELKIDNRSGTRLELVFVAYNEEARIPYLMEYYGQNFDFVILDGGSTDRTIDLVSELGGTVYSRIGESFGESHFVYYANNETRSGRCFTIQCDEYVSHEDLRNVDALLTSRQAHVYGRRIDWFYNRRARFASCEAPKGFYAGNAVFDTSNLHDTLSFGDERPKVVIDVDHLQMVSMKHDFGKFGRYIYQEVEQIRSNPTTSWGRRLLVLARNTQLTVKRFPSNWRLTLLLICQFFATIIIAIMSYLEQKGLPSADDQARFYREHFRRSVINGGGVDKAIVEKSANVGHLGG